MNLSCLRSRLLASIKARPNSKCRRHSIYIYKYIHTHTHTHTHTQRPNSKCRRHSIYTHIHTYTHTHTQGGPIPNVAGILYIYTYIHTYTHTHTHTQGGPIPNVAGILHTYVYTYTHTHTHTHKVARLHKGSAQFQMSQAFYIYTYIHTYTDTHIQTHMDTYIPTDRHFTHTHTHAHIHRHRHRHTETQKQTDRQTQTQTHRHTDTHTHKVHRKDSPNWTATVGGTLRSLHLTATVCVCVCVCVCGCVPGVLYRTAPDSHCVCVCIYIYIYIVPMYTYTYIYIHTYCTICVCTDRGCVFVCGGGLTNKIASPHTHTHTHTHSNINTRTHSNILTHTQWYGANRESSPPPPPHRAPTLWGTPPATPGTHVMRYTARTLATRSTVHKRSRGRRRALSSPRSPYISISIYLSIYLSIYIYRTGTASALHLMPSRGRCTFTIQSHYTAYFWECVFLSFFLEHTIENVNFDGQRRILCQTIMLQIKKTKKGGGFCIRRQCCIAEWKDSQKWLHSDVIYQIQEGSEFFQNKFSTTLRIFRAKGWKFSKMSVPYDIHYTKSQCPMWFATNKVTFTTHKVLK